MVSVLRTRDKLNKLPLPNKKGKSCKPHGVALPTKYHGPSRGILPTCHLSNAVKNF